MSLGELRLFEHHGSGPFLVGDLELRVAGKQPYACVPPPQRVVVIGRLDRFGSLERLHRLAQAIAGRQSAAGTASRQQCPGGPFRTLTWLFSICGSLALVLATVGLAGVVIHAVNRRVREFGVRLSIGATPRDLMRDVLGGSIRMLLPGVVVGLLLAGGLAQLARVMFIGVNVLNPWVYLAVAVLQATIVIIACLTPALRAARVDPLTALRAE